MPHLKFLSDEKEHERKSTVAPKQFVEIILQSTRFRSKLSTKVWWITLQGIVAKHQHFSIAVVCLLGW